MWLLALAAPSAVFLLALAMLSRQRRRPAALAAPLALALTVCIEAALLNLLSVFHAVHRWPLLAAHALVACVAVALVRRGPRRFLHPRAWLPRTAEARATAVVILALSVPIAYSALMYVPNNWDSMTYHLARVAHWLQHRSVGAFETNVARQVTYPPGAEYVITVLQAIAHTDRLANFVQYFAWLVVALAAAPLARSFGAPRPVAPWAALLVAAAPMAVLQASSTQNDLVASAAALAIVIACLPFLHRRPRWRSSDVLLACTTIFSGVLVKPTAVIVTLPLSCGAMVCASLAMVRDRGRARVAVRGAALAALAAAVVLGPELARRAGSSDRGEFSPFLYAPLSFDADRIANVARGFLRQVPVPEAWTSALTPPETMGCEVRESLCLEAGQRSHEDVARNSVSALLTMALLLIGISRWRRLPARSRAALCAMAGGGLLFGLVFRDNVWISRLHLPLFALAPISLAALAGLAWRRSSLRLAAALAATVLWVQGTRAAVHNELRPVPNPAFASLGLGPATYYAARTSAWRGHVQTMAALRRSGCDRLGLYIGGDSYDYPLTWRAMQAGVEVRHMTGPDSWPCAVHSDSGVPPAGAGAAWCAVEEASSAFVACEAPPGSAGDASAAAR